MVDVFTAVFENSNDAKEFARSARKIASQQASLSANEIKLKDGKVVIHFLDGVASVFMLPLIQACKQMSTLLRYDFWASPPQAFLKACGGFFIFNNYFSLQILDFLAKCIYNNTTCVWILSKGEIFNV